MAVSLTDLPPMEKSVSMMSRTQRSLSATSSEAESVVVSGANSFRVPDDPGAASSPTSAAFPKLSEDERWTVVPATRSYDYETIVDDESLAAAAMHRIIMEPADEEANEGCVVGLMPVNHRIVHQGMLAWERLGKPADWNAEQYEEAARMAKDALTRNRRLFPADHDRFASSVGFAERNGRHVLDELPIPDSLLDASVAQPAAPAASMESKFDFSFGSSSRNGTSRFGPELPTPDDVRRVIDERDYQDDGPAQSLDHFVRDAKRKKAFFLPYGYSVVFEPLPPSFAEENPAAARPVPKSSSSDSKGEDGKKEKSGLKATIVESPFSDIPEITKVDDDGEREGPEDSTEGAAVVTPRLGVGGNAGQQRAARVAHRDSLADPDTLPENVPAAPLVRLTDYEQSNLAITKQKKRIRHTEEDDEAGSDPLVAEELGPDYCVHRVRDGDPTGRPTVERMRKHNKVPGVAPIVVGTSAGMQQMARASIAPTAGSSINLLRSNSSLNISPFSSEATRLGDPGTRAEETLGDTFDAILERLRQEESALTENRRGTTLSSSNVRRSVSFRKSSSDSPTIPSALSSLPSAKDLSRGSRNSSLASLSASRESQAATAQPISDVLNAIAKFHRAPLPFERVHADRHGDFSQLLVNDKCEWEHDKELLKPADEADHFMLVSDETREWALKLGSAETIEFISEADMAKKAKEDAEKRRRASRRRTSVGDLKSLGVAVPPTPAERRRRESEAAEKKAAEEAASRRSSDEGKGGKSVESPKLLSRTASKASFTTNGRKGTKPPTPAAGSPKGGATKQQLSRSGGKAGAKAANGRPESGASQAESNGGWSDGLMGDGDIEDGTLELPPDAVVFPAFRVTAFTYDPNIDGTPEDVVGRTEAPSDRKPNVTFDCPEPLIYSMGEVYEEDLDDPTGGAAAMMEEGDNGEDQVDDGDGVANSSVAIRANRKFRFMWAPETPPPTPAAFDFGMYREDLKKVMAVQELTRAGVDLDDVPKDLLGSIETGTDEHGFSDRVKKFFRKSMALGALSASSVDPSSPSASGNIRAGSVAVGRHHLFSGFSPLLGDNTRNARLAALSGGHASPHSGSSRAMLLKTMTEDEASTAAENHRAFTPNVAMFKKRSLAQVGTEEGPPMPAKVDAKSMLFIMPNEKDERLRSKLSRPHTQEQQLRSTSSKLLPELLSKNPPSLSAPTATFPMLSGSVLSSAGGGSASLNQSTMGTEVRGVGSQRHVVALDADEFANAIARNLKRIQDTQDVALSRLRGDAEADDDGAIRRLKGSTQHDSVGGSTLSAIGNDGDVTERSLAGSENTPAAEAVLAKILTPAAQRRHLQRRRIDWSKVERIAWASSPGLASSEPVPEIRAETAEPATESFQLRSSSAMGSEGGDAPDATPIGRASRSQALTPSPSFFSRKTTGSDDELPRATSAMSGGSDSTVGAKRNKSDLGKPPTPLSAARKNKKSAKDDPSNNSSKKKENQKATPSAPEKFPLVSGREMLQDGPGAPLFLPRPASRQELQRQLDSSHGPSPAVQLAALRRQPAEKDLKGSLQPTYQKNGGDTVASATPLPRRPKNDGSSVVFVAKQTLQTRQQLNKGSGGGASPLPLSPTPRDPATPSRLSTAPSPLSPSASRRPSGANSTTLPSLMHNSTAKVNKSGVPIRAKSQQEKNRAASVHSVSASGNTAITKERQRRAISVQREMQGPIQGARWLALHQN